MLTVVTEQDEDVFFEKLEGLCEACLSDYILNGRKTVHKETNCNQHRLCQLAVALNLTFLSTNFEHPKKHKVTWDTRPAQ